MYYKLNKSHPLFEVFVDIKKQIDHSKSIVDELVKEVGADGYASGNSENLMGDIKAFHFESYEKPGDHWTSADRKIVTPWYEPRSAKPFKKQNQWIFDRMKAIPRVSKKLVQEPLQCGFTAYSSGNCLCVFNIPGINWLDECVLFEFPTDLKYTPVDGLVEIMASEFLKLTKKEKEV